MGRYEPLRTFLEGQAGDRIQVTFEEIEAVLGVPLPASKRYPAWWSNNPSNNPMTKVWLAAGFVTEQVEIGAEKLVFRRAERDRGGFEDERPAFGRAEASNVPPADWLAKLRARLGGTVQVAPGWDLTRPTGEVWDAERE